MRDAVAGLHEGFGERLGALLGRHENAISGLTYEQARQLGAQGAEAAVAPLIWAAAVGERWSTTTVGRVLACHDPPPGTGFGTCYLSGHPIGAFVEKFDRLLVLPRSLVNWRRAPSMAPINLDGFEFARRRHRPTDSSSPVKAVGARIRTLMMCGFPGLPDQVEGSVLAERGDGPHRARGEGAGHAEFRIPLWPYRNRPPKWTESRSVELRVPRGCYLHPIAYLRPASRQSRSHHLDHLCPPLVRGRM